MTDSVYAKGHKNMLWCSWLRHLNIFDRDLVYAHELHYFDAWMDGSMTMNEILLDSGVTQFVGTGVAWSD